MGQYLALSDGLPHNLCTFGSFRFMGAERTLKAARVTSKRQWGSEQDGELCHTPRFAKPSWTPPSVGSPSSPVGHLANAARHTFVSTHSLPDLHEVICAQGIWNFRIEDGDGMFGQTFQDTGEPQLASLASA